MIINIAHYLNRIENGTEMPRDRHFAHVLIQWTFNRDWAEAEANNDVQRMGFLAAQHEIWGACL